MTPPSYRHILITLASALLIIFFEYLGFLEGINNYFYDLSFRLRGDRPPSKNIVLVTIHEGTLEKLGRWPIRRLYYASLLDRLRQADVIAFDITMSEPSEDDALLAEAISRHGKIILPVLIDNQMNIRYPAQALSPYRTGHIHVEPGIDGNIREVYHTLFFKNLLLPSFSSAIYETASRLPFQRTKPPTVQFSRPCILQMDAMRINYCGSPGTFERVFFSDVIHGVYPLAFFKDKIVFVGCIAEGIGDHQLTPFSQERKGMSGIEIQANILNTLLTNNPIKVVAPWVRWLLTIFLSFLSLVYFLRTREKKAAFLGLFILFLFTATTYIFFSAWNIWIAPAIYYLTMVFVFAITYTLKMDDAIGSLDRAYKTILPNLRWKGRVKEEKDFKKGIRGILTPGGIHSKIRILIDVTNQLLFEKELTDRALLSDIDGVVLFGPEGMNVMTNDQALVVCKANSLEVESADRFLKTITPYIMENTETENILMALNAPKERIAFTISLPSPEKKFFKVDGSAFDVAEKKYLLFILSDITKIKELEIIKGQIISSVSHELKTPMTSIQGFSEILSMNLQGTMKEFASIIHGESKRLIRFLDTYLDITRIEEGRHPIKLTPVILSDVVREVVSFLTPIAEEKTITLYTEMPSVGGHLMIDRDLTKQCLFNLLENAIKYSPPKRDITIKLIEQPDQVKIEVIDHGYGIQQEEIDKIFEKFYRSRSEDIRNIQGSGLGLTFVKEAIEVQGGKITVVSNYGQGSTFSFYFPVIGS